MANKEKKNQLKNRIIDFLSKKPGKRFKSKTIARALGINQDDYVEFRNYLRAMSKQGIIQKSGKNAYQLEKIPPFVVGRLRVKSQGYGFVKPEDSDQELFISHRNMANALDGDLVAVQQYAKTKKGFLPEGRVDHVIERKRKYIVGTYKEGKYFNYVAPDDLKILWDIIVHEQFSKGAKPGQKVVVTIDYWEDRDLNPTGKVVEILGYPDEPGVDISSVVYKFDLPISFPESAENEAKGISGEIKPDDLKGRMDLRDTLCFTIDPPDAKDFDDAVSLEITDDGRFWLGVHIADVSHYVKRKSSIDEEAFDRGTSIYLVDRVIPMLPEKLSNQVCSLQPDKDRLTLSVMIKLNRKGHVEDYSIQPSVIRNARRFTYKEVQQILNEKQGQFVETLLRMRDLSQILYKNRIKKGSLDFETPEAEIDLDEQGNPVNIRRKERLQSHQMVEEFMLLANKVVAEHVAITIPEQNEDSKKWPFIYRVHEQPSSQNVEEFGNLVRSLGFHFKERKHIHPKHFQDILRQVHGLPEEDIVNQVMLRSMMKAKYDMKNVGHFGIAFSYYTHFTSPIRRYPDLVVHRLLKEYPNSPSEERLSQLRKTLPEVCRIASEREISALEAERQSIKIKQTEFMVDKIGEIYSGIISGIVSFGIFVELTDYLIDGLVHVKDLTSDYYIFDEPNYRLIGRTTGKIYRLGDRVKVRVIRVVPEERLIDFEMVEDLNGEKKKPSKWYRKGMKKQQ